MDEGGHWDRTSDFQGWNDHELPLTRAEVSEIKEVNLALGDLSLTLDGSDGLRDVHRDLIDLAMIATEISHSISVLTHQIEDYHKMTSTDLQARLDGLAFTFSETYKHLSLIQSRARQLEYIEASQQ